MIPRSFSYKVLIILCLPMNFNQDRTVLAKAESGCMHVISEDSGLPSSTDIAGLLESDVVTMSCEDDSQVLEAVPYVPGQDRTAEVLYFLCLKQTPEKLTMRE